MKRANEIGTASNSATPEGNQIEGSFVICLNIWKADHHRKILFSLEEKEIGRAQNKKSKEYFSAVWRARCAVAGLASLVGVLLKKSSNINQKTPPFDSRSLSRVCPRDSLMVYDQRANEANALSLSKG